MTSKIMRHQLQRIRRSDTKTKRKWLIGLSRVSVLNIIFAWILYMQAFVFTRSDDSTKEDVHIAFWPVLKTGLSITGSSIRHSFNDILLEMPEVGRRTTTIENPE